MIGGYYSHAESAKTEIGNWAIICLTRARGNVRDKLGNFVPLDSQELIQLTHLCSTYMLVYTLSV